MSYNVETIPIFEKLVKRLLKKYPSLKDDLLQLADSLILQPDIGVPIGKNFYKIRLNIKAKLKGKSGGARVITFIKISKETVYFASIFDKSEKSNITNKELNEIMKIIPD